MEEDKLKGKTKTDGRQSIAWEDNYDDVYVPLDPLIIKEKGYFLCT